MIITNDKIYNINILDEHLVPNSESFRDIPLIESHNERFIVKYDYIKGIIEDYGYELEDSINELLETNNLNIDNIELSISESDAISNMEDINILNEYGIEYTIHPISDNHIISKYVDYMVESWLNSGNDEYINLLESPELLLEEDYDKDELYDRSNLDYSYEDKKSMWRANDMAKSGKVDAYYYDPKTKKYSKSDKPVDFTDANFLVKIKRFLTDKPRDFLAKVAARLRETYRKWLIKAKENHGNGNEKWYKRIARRLVQAIDWILRKIEGLRVNYRKRAKRYIEDKFAGQKNLVGVSMTYTGGKDKGAEDFIFNSSGKAKSELGKKNGKVNIAFEKVLWGNKEKPKNIDKILRK